MDSGKEEKEKEKTREMLSAGVTTLEYRTVVDVVSSSCDSSYSCLCVVWVIYTVFVSFFSRACHDIASLTIRHITPHNTTPYHITHLSRSNNFYLNRNPYMC
jgi:hypothetical protein